MNHWCFTCSKYVKDAEYDKCKSSEHDIDYEDIYTPGQNNIENKNEPKQASRLIEFLKQNIKQIVKSSNDSSRVYILVSNNNLTETIQLGTENAKSWLKATYYDKTHELYSEQTYADALDLVRAKAQFNPKIQAATIYKRIAFFENKIYYDLCLPDWKIVRITQDDISIIDHGTAAPYFNRGKNQSAQIEPNLTFTGNPLEDFCKLLRIDNELFKIHLVSFLIENIPVPIMAIIGQQGSIKSTQSGLVKRLIDPAGTKLEDNLSHLPKTIEDLNIHLSHNYVVCFDNVSYITDEFSDTFCKAITGAGYPKRKYYTDSDEIILKFQRKIVLNGITVNIENGDLAERTITYFTKEIPSTERKTAEQVDADFRRLLPDLIGQICTILQKALILHPVVKVEVNKLPRMADFAIWGEAISQALGNKKGRFLELYHDAINQGNEILNESNPLIPYLEQELKDQNEITVPAGTFYQRLSSYAESNQYDKKTRTFPKGSNKLRGFIERSKPLLAEHGFSVKIFKNTERNNFTKNTTLVGVVKISSLSPPCPPLDIFPNEQSEDGEDGEHTLNSNQVEK